MTRLHYDEATLDNTTNYIGGPNIWKNWHSNLAASKHVVIRLYYVLRWKINLGPDNSRTGPQHRKV